jgi:glutamate-1-semialdehyde 2,1-aminomutase
MVKFTKNASDATSAAVRLSRAATGRDHVALCDHPFYSGQDWFVGTLPLDAGVPQALRDLTHRFWYNDIDSLRGVLDEHPAACVIMEPVTGTVEPEPGYLTAVQRLCAERGTVLVFDETITGFRWSEHGAGTSTV